MLLNSWHEPLYFEIDGGPFGDDLLVLVASLSSGSGPTRLDHEELSHEAAAHALYSQLSHAPQLVSDLFCAVFETTPRDSACAMMEELVYELGAQRPRLRVSRRRHFEPVSSLKPAARKDHTEDAVREPQPHAFVAVETVDQHGMPVPFTRCEVQTPGGDVRMLVTDAQGRGLLDRLSPGQCQIGLPDLDGRSWRTVVTSAPTHARRGADHLVKPGDALISIARAHGISDWRWLWAHDDNAALRAMRRSPHVLWVGDRVRIPATDAHAASLPTDQQHRFVIDREEMEVCVRLQDRAKRPLADLSYRLLYQVDGQTVERPGAAPTDGSGLLRERVPVGTAKVSLHFKRPRMSFELLVNQLPPAFDAATDQPIESGVDARLHALGFSTGSVRDRVAIFQKVILGRSDADGSLDESTCRALEREYGV